MKVIAVVVTYNGTEWYERCFGSLAASSQPVTTVVIDNGSTDGTREWFRMQDSERMKIILSDTNLGFGQANNKGISIAIAEGADYVFLLNQDAWVEPDTIECLIKFQQDNKEYGILSPVHLNGKGNKLDRNFSMYLNKAEPDIISDLFLKATKKVYSCSYVNAAAWLMSMDCIKKVGGFDPIFFHYGEDENYCQRVLFHGLKIGILPDAVIYHDRDDRGGIRKEYLALHEWQQTILGLTDINNEAYLDNLYKLKKQAVISTIWNLVKLRIADAVTTAKTFMKLNSIKCDVEMSRARNTNWFAHL